MQENNNKATVLTQSFLSNNYQINITGEIGPPDLYIEELSAIRNAGEGDSIEIFLNTPGGHVNTGAQFVSAIQNSKATVIAHLESECHSAGTYIALACDGLVVYDNAFMLIHNYSGGSYGKGDDSLEQVKSTRDWIRDMMRRTYVPFLSEKELDSVFDNKDIYLRADDIKKRWDRVVEDREAAAKEANDKLQEELKEQVNNL
jgi:ATP-dependent protease ClpP protease subunit